MGMFEQRVPLNNWMQGIMYAAFKCIVKGFLGTHSAAYQDIWFVLFSKEAERKKDCVQHCSAQSMSVQCSVVQVQEQC